jgi:ligand-binding sensor domain-containing protein
LDLIGWWRLNSNSVFDTRDSTGDGQIGCTINFAIALLAIARASWTYLAYAAEDSLRQDVLTSWTRDHGLPQNFVRAITQTADGFLWVGTMNGLARFDGLHFRGFAKDGPPGCREISAPSKQRGLPQPLA